MICGWHSKNPWLNAPTNSSQMSITLPIGVHSLSECYFPRGIIYSIISVDLLSGFANGAFRAEIACAPAIIIAYLQYKLLLSRARYLVAFGEKEASRICDKFAESAMRWNLLTIVLVIILGVSTFSAWLFIEVDALHNYGDPIAWSSAAGIATITFSALGIAGACWRLLHFERKAAKRILDRKHYLEVTLEGLQKKASEYAGLSYEDIFQKARNLICQSIRDIGYCRRTGISEVDARNEAWLLSLIQQKLAPRGYPHITSVRPFTRID
jgi:hypothetical protein